MGDPPEESPLYRTWWGRGRRGGDKKAAPRPLAGFHIEG